MARRFIRGELQNRSGDVLRGGWVNVSGAAVPFVGGVRPSTFVAPATTLVSGGCPVRGDGLRSVVAADVLKVGHRLKMCGVHTGGVEAEVVKFQTVRDRATNHLVSGTVGECHPIDRESDGAVAPRGSRPRELDAAGGQRGRWAEPQPTQQVLWPVVTWSSDQGVAVLPPALVVEIAPPPGFEGSPAPKYRTSTLRHRLASAVGRVSGVGAVTPIPSSLGVG